MPKINQAFREITCKIVFYGPGAGGKTTNLQFVHGNVPEKHRGKLTSLATEQDRTLFFDYLPLDIGEVKGYKTKFQLYTVPGQVFYNQTRKLVLREADAIAFIADSQAGRLKDNIDSFNNLNENLRELGVELSDIPFVMQYNKRDLPDALPVEDLESYLNPKHEFMSFEAVATEGKGVRETLREVSSQVLKRLNATANIVSDEELVGERLGVAPGAGLPSETETAAAGTPISPRRQPTEADKNAPDLEIMQTSRFFWRGIAVGSGTVSLSTLREESGIVEYALTSNHKIMGIRRSIVRTLSYIGEDRRVTPEGAEKIYYVLRDSGGGKSAPISTFVQKKVSPRIYLVYQALVGEMKVGPEGEPIDI